MIFTPVCSSVKSFAEIEMGFSGMKKST